MTLFNIINTDFIGLTFEQKETYLKKYKKRELLSLNPDIATSYGDNYSRLDLINSIITLYPDTELLKIFKLKNIEISELKDGDLIVFEDGTVETKINSNSIHLFGGLQARCKKVGEIKNIEEVVFTHIIQGYKIAFTSKDKIDF